MEAEPVPVLLTKAEHPAPVRMLEVPWKVYSRTNMEKAQADLLRAPMMCTPVKGYENLGLNMAELKRFIEQSLLVIDYYEKAVFKEEPDVPK